MSYKPGLTTEFVPYTCFKAIEKKIYRITPCLNFHKTTGLKYMYFHYFSCIAQVYHNHCIFNKITTTLTLLLKICCLVSMIVKKNMSIPNAISGKMAGISILKMP